LEAAQSAGDDEIVCIANNDILFDDESMKWCDQLQRGECYCLSRVTPKWEKDVSRVIHWLQADGQDAWMFRGKPPLLASANFPQGMDDCDWRFADLLHFEAKLKVSNPSNSIRIYHLHVDEGRLPKQRVPRTPGMMIPKTMLEPSYLDADPAKPKP
jgi:hypothetical protein